MKALELLAPARNVQIGIAAIDCGADAVYIGADAFGARKDAANPVGDIRELCDHAHKFGARVFLTVNTIIDDDEMERAHALMLDAQEAGVDAFIIRDTRICGWDDITVPLHASTQCAIRDARRARLHEDLGCGRIILERELSLAQIKEICESVDCEVECFVHGALCVCYSGECRLSEHIDGRSADRGECIQACRSLYDLQDSDGRTLARSKALLSLKDYNLLERLEDLAEAGVCSFKIEGRLKNASYVKNVVREYSIALDNLIAKHPDKYCRASFGVVSGGFRPDVNKTFNRSYTELYIDGKRGNWACIDAPKSMGELLGTIESVRTRDRYSVEVRVAMSSKGTRLSNGDGFAITTPAGITGFRGDLCEGNCIVCKPIKELRKGIPIYRNISAEFEKAVENDMPRREIPVGLFIDIHGKYTMDIRAVSQDGREIVSTFNMDVDTATNTERAAAMIREQLSKRSEGYVFALKDLSVNTPGGSLPLMSASTLNSIRRLVASDIDTLECNRMELHHGNHKPDAEEVASRVINDELMRSKYCVKYELGMCPKNQGGKDPRPLYITNNGRRFELAFDCAKCEMVVREARK